MRRTAVIALVLLATLAGASPALATPAQDAFGITQAWSDAPGLDGDGLVVAVVDTGVDASHPALAGKVIGWHDLVADEEEPYDDLGHGTWVAGIIAGRQVGPLDAGVAPAAKIVGVKVVDADSGSSVAQIAAGIDWVIAHRAEFGVDIINLSIGDPVTGGAEIDAAEAAVDRAVNAGLTVIAAAGNRRGLGNVATPGSAEHALTVGAMADQFTPLLLGGPGFAPVLFSSSGPTAAGINKPDVMGPTRHTAAMPDMDEGAEGSGTSGGAAFVSGVAALMLDANPALTPAQVKALVMQTAEDWGRPLADPDYGAGRLDAYAALHAAGAALATPPAGPDHVAFTGAVGAGGSTQRSVTVAGPGAPLVATLLPDPDGSSPDLDLRLRDAGGSLLASAVTGERRESLALTAPAAGSYTLEVTGPAGAIYSLDVSGILDAGDVTPPALTLETPGAGAILADGELEITGHAGTAPGDFQGVTARVFRGASEVRSVRAQLLPDGSWTAHPGPLPDGTYEIRAEQGDRRHNVTQATRTFTIDTTPPDTTLSRSGTTFSYGADEPVARFECRLDGAAWVVCGALGVLAPGDHTLEARAVDLAGNVDAIPATVTWNVAAPPLDQSSPPPPAAVQGDPPAPDTDDPALGLASPLPRGLAALRGRGVSFALRCDEACTIRAELKITAKLARRHKVSRRLAAASAQMTGAGTVTLKLKPSRAVQKRLKRVRSLGATLVVVATDAAGNEGRLSRGLRLR